MPKVEDQYSDKFNPPERTAKGASSLEDAKAIKDHDQYSENSTVDNNQAQKRLGG